MTKDEINEKTNAKVKQITDLCSLLQITISAEEVVTEGGFIKKVLYYLDNEKYPEEIAEVQPAKTTPSV